MKRSPQEISRQSLRKKRKQIRRQLRKRHCHKRLHRRLARRRLKVGFQNAIVLQAPEIFGMYQLSSHEHLVGFVRELVRWTLIQELKVEIDFRAVKKLYPDGTLLVFAELHRILQRRPGCVRFIRAKNALVNATLCHLGFYSLMGFEGRIHSDNPDVTHWQFLKGVRGGTEDIGPKIKDQSRLPDEKRRGLVKSIGEAITNVTQHAYDAPRQDGTGIAGEGGWWAFIREEEADFTVAFCDLGLGVPVTAPKKLGERLLDLVKPLGSAFGLEGHQDAQYIAATIEDSRTRTNLDNRGKGFRDIMDTWKNGSDGYVQIFSNRGCYYSHLEKGEPRHDMRNYAHSIFGTLIAWRLTLQKEAT